MLGMYCVLLRSNMVDNMVEISHKLCSEVGSLGDPLKQKGPLGKVRYPHGPYLINCWWGE